MVKSNLVVYPRHVIGAAIWVNDLRPPAIRHVNPEVVLPEEASSMNFGITEILLILFVVMANIAILILIIVGAIFIYRKLSSR